MEAKTISILLGGILPAILFGVAGIFQKLSSQTTISTGAYLMTIGVGTVIMGGVFMLVQKNATFPANGMLYAGLYALFWTIGMAGIALALQKYGGQISQLVPLYNMNTLVTVVIGLILLAEWHTVNSGKLLLAAILVIIGGVLAATA
ncbi:MAG: hypothetical protein H6636_10800 [Anaerolineales bacterium]|nr:hypothetical protein [Anaerolineales bacterium]